MFHSDLFANRGRKGQRNGERVKWRWGERGKSYAGGCTLKEKRGKTRFYEHPFICMLAVVLHLLICSFLSPFTMKLDRNVYC